MGRQQFSTSISWIERSFCVLVSSKGTYVQLLEINPFHFNLRVINCRFLRNWQKEKTCMFPAFAWTQTNTAAIQVQVPADTEHIVRGIDLLVALQGHCIQLRWGSVKNSQFSRVHYSVNTNILPCNTFSERWCSFTTNADAGHAKVTAFESMPTFEEDCACGTLRSLLGTRRCPSPKPFRRRLSAAELRFSGRRWHLREGFLQAYPFQSVSTGE